jgi:putative glutamine amidotransferase
MKLIAVTQRVDLAPARAERKDALDQAWSRFLSACGCVAVPLPNHVATAKRLWDRIDFGGLLLTGGNDLASTGGDAPERDETERALLNDALRKGVAIMGVCRGMQLIQDMHGVPLLNTPGHVMRAQTISRNGGEDIVNSFHRRGAKVSVPELRVWARAQDGVVKAVRHVCEPILGIMWHPERFTPFRTADVDMFRDHFGGEPCEA